MKKITATNLLKYSLLTASISVLASCAATSTMIEHRTLETQTSLSKTIFLDPVASSEKTIFIVVKNTSNENIDINRPLEDALRAHGYRVVKSPVDAHYLLQANILSIGKMSIAASQTALGGGYGSALAGGVVGASLGHLSGESGTMLAGGLAGGLVGLAADSLVKNVNFTLISDVQISERVGRGTTVSEQHKASLSQGSGSRLTQTSTRTSNFERYRTRIVSNAEQVNLSFAKARPALEKGLVQTLAGIF
jgi:outer membrane lipoprotein SlyB